MKKFLAVLVILVMGLFFSTSGRAEDVSLDEIVVTPSRTEESANSTASSVSVITSKDIAQRGIFFLKDALKTENGLDVAGTGGFGSTASVFLRGASAAQTRLIIDGIKVYNPTSVDAGYDFGNLNTANIDRIEIARGLQSGLYGSNAIGGVINIITKKGHGKPTISVSTEGGSFYTSRENLEINGQKDKLHFAFAQARFDTKGFSRAKEKNNNPENDAYQNTNTSLRLDYDLSQELTIGLINRYTHSRGEFDDYDYTNDRPVDDIDRVRWNDEGLSSLILEHNITEKYKQKLQLSFTRNYQRGTDNTDEYERDWYDGRTYQLDWQSDFELTNFYKLITGIDYLTEKADTYYYHNIWGESDFPKNTTNTKGFFLENKFKLLENMYFNSSYRVDDHSSFGDYGNYKFELSYLIEKTNTRIKSLYGTGFKSPSLYQLFAPPMYGLPTGNSNLSPEKSQGYEIGVEQKLFTEKLSADITYFKTHFKDLIDFIYGTGYVNLNKARTDGLETSLKFKQKNTTIKLGYTLLDTENKENGNELLKRAKNKFNMSLNQAFEKWDVNYQLNYVGSRQDYQNKLLKAYLLANISVNYQIDTNFTVFGKVENMFNEKYEESAGYQTAPISVYGGVKVEF